jgi:hypothetical protein
MIFRRKHGDCIITALGAALGTTYEDAAGLIDVPLDADGMPDVPKDGFALNQIIPRLFGKGIAGVHLVSSLHPRAQDIRGLPSPDDVLTMLRGHRAIVAPICHCLSAAEADHYFCWDGERIVEDRMEPAEPIPLMQEYCNMIGPVLEAVVLLPVSWTRRTETKAALISGGAASRRPGWVAAHDTQCRQRAVADCVAESRSVG